MSDNKSRENCVVHGDDAINDYLQRLSTGQLTEEEQRIGISRKPKLGELKHGANGPNKDEYPDENMPND